MDKEELKTMPDYVKNLPQEVQDMIFEGVWQDRTLEIAKKYSLNNNQTDALVNNTLFVLIGIDTPEILFGSMVSELGISKLLTDQITKDLENRVFDYALNFVETKSKKKAVPIPEVSKNELSKTLEVKPQNLPMIEKGELAHDVVLKTPSQKLEPVKENIIPKPVQTYKPVSKFGVDESIPDENKSSETSDVDNPESSTPTSASRITYKQEGSGQPIQRPVPVPRFTAVPMENSLANKENEAVEKDAGIPQESNVLPQAPLIGNSKPAAPMKVFKSPQSIMDDKLKNVTPAIAPKVEANKPTPTNKPAVDPYREPIE